MTSSSTRGTDSSAPSASSKSFLSRLRAPLKSKSRNAVDFSIQPDDPHRQYSPGDLITGSVILKVLKPLRITHLVISLHGYAQVFKNPNAPGDAYRMYSATVGSGKGKKSGSYFGNGFASLFEDEAVLCGEGRLGEGVYHFNFELEFPSKGLPSSIDFERGTISYVLTATLTRPTTISPTTSCDARVQLMDVIDIAPVPEPKPRTISLEPVSRRARVRANARKRPIATTEMPQRGPETLDLSRNSRPELNNVTEESDSPGSPAPSDVSFESQFSSGNASGTEYGVRSINTAVEGGVPQNGNRSVLKDKIITATIDVLKGGFLRGDQIPIKISVSHTKHVRSLKGIIITLYRQARVDMHPALPVAPNSKGDKTKSEEYYPKSRTGLGGLSLSSAGSSHLFRKDLSQSFAPLFVDPRTLTAEVKCAVRVPDEAFPTISNVPGAMISFKYFVEVVIDIQGKLTGLDRYFANAGLVTVPSAYGNAPGPNAGDNSSSGQFATWGGNFIDTDSIRREKGIVSSLFEVVVGTKDSTRNGKRKQRGPDAVADPQNEVHEIALDSNHATNGSGVRTSGTGDGEYYDYDQDGQYYDHYAYEEAYQGGYYDGPAYEQVDSSRPAYEPPPNHEEEEELSEKERIRRAEARLLPSQPPGIEEEPTGPSVARGIPPSAPLLPEDDDPNPPYMPPEASAPSSSQLPPQFTNANASLSSRTPEASSTPRATEEDLHTSVTGSSLTIHASSQPPAAQGNDPNAHKPLPNLPPSSPAPGYTPSSSVYVAPTDDKQELQRRRLELETSAPPGDDEDEAPGSSAPPAIDMQNMTLAPSAPVLDEDDEGLIGPIGPSSGHLNERSINEALPAYRR